MVYVVLCAAVDSGVIAAWSRDQTTLEDAINELKTEKVAYTVLKDLVDCNSSTILGELEVLEWARDGRARMETLLGKFEEDGNWEERFMLLQAVEGNKAGTMFKDIEVRLSSSASPRTALPRLASHRLEPPHIDVARTCAGGRRGCQHGHGPSGGAAAAARSSEGELRAAVCVCVPQQCVHVCMCVCVHIGGAQRRRQQAPQPEPERIGCWPQQGMCVCVCVCSSSRATV